MDEIVIAFDVDGTLLSNEEIPPATPPHLRPKTSVNVEAVILLQILSRMKNTRILVWSGGGKEYAEEFVRLYGLEKFVDKCYGKEACEEEVDICFDDVHACKLADKNIVVKFK